MGPDHPGTAASLSSLAHLLQARGEPDTARPMFERALAIRERALGPTTLTRSRSGAEWLPCRRSPCWCRAGGGRDDDTFWLAEA